MKLVLLRHVGLVEFEAFAERRQANDAGLTEGRARACGKFVVHWLRVDRGVVTAGTTPTRVDVTL